MGPEGSLGSLPELVRRIIARKSNLTIEMTRGCTNACPFCPVAEKGPVVEKIRFDNLEKIFRYYKQYNKTPKSLVKPDLLYEGSDPFDVKWIIDGEEYDYLSVVKRYLLTMREYSSLFTSTAVPIGEEFRVFQLADLLLQIYERKLWPDINILRISLTDANANRVAALQSILGALYTNPFRGDKDEKDENEKMGILISANRNRFAKRTGKAWIKGKGQISLRDMYGIWCDDSMIIRLHDVRGRITHAASNERPEGYAIVPVKHLFKKSGVTRYSIVHFHLNTPFGSRGELYKFKKIYSNPRLSVLDEKSGKWKKKEITLPLDPHRALLRLVSYLDYLILKRGRGNYTQTDKQTFRKHLDHEVKTVIRYMVQLKRRKPEGFNWSMTVLIKYLREYGFIDSLLLKNKSLRL